MRKLAEVQVELHHVAQEPAQHTRGLGVDGAGLGHGHGVVAESRQRQRLQQSPAVGVRVAAHAPLAGRRQRGQLLAEPAALVEQLLGPIALEPGFQLLQVPGGPELGDRHLVRTPVAFDRLAIDELRAGPALGGAQHDHRPAWALRGGRRVGTARLGLDLLNPRQHLVQRAGQRLVHDRGVVALDEIRLMAVAAHQVGQLLVADAGQQRGVGDLVAVEVQDRQHRAVASRVQELVGMPARGQRAGLRFAVAHDAGDDQSGVVEGRPIGVGQRIAQFAPFMDRARHFGRHMAGHAVRPGELAKQPQQPVAVVFDGRIVLGVRAFQIAVRHDARPAVARADDIDHVQAVLLDQPVQVHIQQVQARCRAPMAQQARLDVFDLQRRFEQRVGLQVDLTH